MYVCTTRTLRLECGTQATNFSCSDPGLAMASDIRVVLVKLADRLALDSPAAVVVELATAAWERVQQHQVAGQSAAGHPQQPVVYSAQKVPAQ